MTDNHTKFNILFHEKMLLFLYIIIAYPCQQNIVTTNILAGKGKESPMVNIWWKELERSLEQEQQTMS